MSAKPHAVIYVPGLGDHRIASQRLALKVWRLHKVEPYMFQMHWNAGEDFDVTFRRLLRLIDRLHSEGRAVSLCGASAGASVAVIAYAARPEIIRGIGLICGKILRPEGISDWTYRHNPAFKTSMDRLPEALASLDTPQRQRIISMRPLADLSVPPADTYVPDAAVATLPVSGHVFGIAYGLTLGSGKMIRFLTGLAER